MTTADELRAILERCSTVYAVVHHVSRSGMQRRIDFYVIDNQPTHEHTTQCYDGMARICAMYPEYKPTMRRISHLIAKVLGLRLAEGGVVVVSDNDSGEYDHAWYVMYEAKTQTGPTGAPVEVRYL